MADRERFVIATGRFEVLIWKVGDPGYRTMSGHIAINAIGVSDDGKKIAIGDATGVVMWSGTGDALGESRDVQGGVDKLAFTRDGSVLVGAGAENRVFVWDTSSFHMRQGIEGRGAIDELALDPAGVFIATVGARDARARVWSMPHGRQVVRVESERIAVDRDVWLTANASDLSARAFATGAELRRIAIPTPDPTRVVPGANAAERVGMLATDPRLLGAARASDSVAISRDGKRVALGSGNTVQLWNVDGTLLFSVASTDAYALDDRGELFATASADGLIRIWDAAGRLLDRLVGHQGRITRLEFAPGGGRLIAQSNDRRATLWNVELETRTPDQLAAFVEPRTSWRLSGVHLVPR